VRRGLPFAFVLLPLAVCGCRPANDAGADDCGPPIAASAHDGHIVTVAEVFHDPVIVWTEHLGSVRVEAGRSYAVVDDEGYVGTLRPTTRNMRCAFLAMEGSCLGFEEWNARWVDEPTRRWGSIGRGGVLAFGPVNARHVSARRVVPLQAALSDENDMPMPTPPRADTRAWTRLVAIAVGEASIEVWGRTCAANTASVRELRVLEDGETRVVHRATTKDRPM
jgi:hypothetical protein